MKNKQRVRKHPRNSKKMSPAKISFLITWHFFSFCIFSCLKYAASDLWLVYCLSVHPGSDLPKAPSPFKLIQQKDTFGKLCPICVNTAFFVVLQRQHGSSNTLLLLHWRIMTAKPVFRQYIHHQNGHDILKFYDIFSWSDMRCRRDVVMVNQSEHSITSHSPCPTQNNGISRLSSQSIVCCNVPQDSLGIIKI